MVHQGESLSVLSLHNSDQRAPPKTRGRSKGIKTKRIKTTNIIDTVCSKVQNKFTNRRIETEHHPHGVHQSALDSHARLLPNRVRGREARASATLLDLRRGGVLVARAGRSVTRNLFSGFGLVTELGEGTSQSGHAHNVWKISSSLTLRGGSSVIPWEDEGAEVSVSVHPMVSSTDDEQWRSTMDRNGGPSCPSDRRLSWDR